MNGRTLQTVLLGMLMAVGAGLPAALMAVQDPTWRALMTLGACLLFLLIGLFLPQPTMPDSVTGRHKTKGPQDESQGPPTPKS